MATALNDRSTVNHMQYRTAVQMLHIGIRHTLTPTIRWPGSDTYDPNFYAKFGRLRDLHDVVDLR
jgi:hypothetical protein